MPERVLSAFINSFNGTIYAYDRFQNLDLRFILGGGVGYIAWKGERGRLDVLGGDAACFLGWSR